tara:strand:- start:5350 stop:6000 length:651 start_codon:yes stop_codon:yes gene_type:complete
MKLNIIVPNNLSEITLRQYKHFLKIQKKVDDENFLNAKIIEIFCNIDLKDVMRLKINDTELIVNTLTEMFEQKPNLVTSFKLNKVNYGFHPQLDDLTLGEYIDLDTFIGDWENIEKAMAVLYRPIVNKIKDKYIIEEYKVGNDDRVLDMPMDAVLSSIFFLWNLGIDLSEAMMNYLDKAEGQTLTPHLTSQINGGGTNQFLASLKETLQDMKISLN